MVGGHRFFGAGHRYSWLEAIAFSAQAIAIRVEAIAIVVWRLIQVPGSRMYLASSTVFLIAIERTSLESQPVHIPGDSKRAFHAHGLWPGLRRRPRQFSSVSFIVALVFWFKMQSSKLQRANQGIERTMKDTPSLYVSVSA